MWATNIPYNKIFKLMSKNTDFINEIQKVVSAILLLKSPKVQFFLSNVKFIQLLIKLFNFMSILEIHFYFSLEFYIKVKGFWF